MHSSEHRRSSRIAGEIRAEMARGRVTAASLSRATGIKGPTLSRRLNGLIPLTVDELEQIAAHLGLTVTEIIARTEDVAA